MKEHRIIERMVGNLKVEIEKVREKRLDSMFIDQTIDFFRTYADRTHHGKEEDILFRELRLKNLKPGHKVIMDELVSEHILARRTVGEILEANDEYL